MSIIIDFLAVLLLAIFVIIGAKRGFVNSIIGLVATALSFVSSYLLSDMLANAYLPNYINVSGEISIRALKILIFDQINDVFSLVDAIACEGTSFDCVEYIHMDEKISAIKSM